MSGLDQDMIAVPFFSIYSHLLPISGICSIFAISIVIILSRTFRAHFLLPPKFLPSYSLENYQNVVVVHSLPPSS